MLRRFRLSLCLNQSNPQKPSLPISGNSTETKPETEPAPVDPVKLAFQRAKAYKKFKLKQNPAGKNGDNVGGPGLGNGEVLVSVEVEMEKDKEYRKNEEVDDGVEDGGESETDKGLKGEVKSSLPDEVAPRNIGKKEELKISSIDFVGLEFADKKKSRGLPPGLVPLSDPFPEGDLPEVEIIVGDTSRFDEATTSTPEQVQEDNLDIYKPKVSTWGVFPRPSNISKTFGGGRVIQPGDSLETEEDRAAKDKRTRQLIAEYKKKMGLNIDAKLKAECEKILKDGDSLMGSGKLKEALPYYQKVMDKMPFQSELHGLAALQWSTCQDSLSRPEDARIMYEKLQSHPNAEVSKKARQFMFSFRAMEMMKVTSSSLPMNTGYQNYFEAFVDNKSNYPLKEIEVEEGTLNQALPYLILAASPILLVLFAALQRGNTH